ncbi:diguanylate cyclase [bacterium 3DAC]|nr:diguanylate cyclase [bacterium 3DAC]
MEDIYGHLKRSFEGSGVHALYVYGPEGIGKRKRVMSALKKMGYNPHEVPLISTYTALGNFLKAIWDLIPEHDRSMYMGMLRGAVGRFFAHYVPTLAPEIEKMGIDLSRSIVNVDVVFPHIATIINDISGDIVWVLNDYFALDAADLRKFVNIMYETSLSSSDKKQWDNVRIVFISEVDDPKILFPRVRLREPSIDEFEKIVGHRVSQKEYELAHGNPGVYQVLLRLVKRSGHDLRMYSSLREVIEDNLTQSQKALYTALTFVSKYHVGRFGPTMRVWATSLAENISEEDFRFLEEVGLVESLDYLSNITGIPVWRVQYAIAIHWISSVSHETLEDYINRSVCSRLFRGINDALFILSMHARDIGLMRKAHAYLIMWIKSLKERFFLQRVLEVLDDLGYIENPEMLPKPASAYVARFLYTYFGSHPALMKFASYLENYVEKRPLLLAMFVEFVLLYGDVSDTQVKAMLSLLRRFYKTHRGYPVSVWVLWGLGRINEELNNYETADVYYNEGLSLANMTSVPDSLRLELINALGRVLFLQGKLEEAREQWVRLLEEAKAIQDPIFISKAYNNLAVYEQKHSFRYSMELFRLAYEVAMGAGTTSAAVSLSNYLAGAYELITQDKYMERLREAQSFIDSIGVPFYTLLFYSQTYEPLIRYRLSALVKQWEEYLTDFFADEGRRKVYAEKYVEILAFMALERVLIEDNLDEAIALLKESEDIALQSLSSAAPYISTIYEVYMEIGMFFLDEEIFKHGYEAMRSIGKEMPREYLSVNMYFEGLVEHAIKGLSDARRYYLRNGRKFKAGIMSLVIAEIFYREGNEEHALIHYRRALSEFEGLGVFHMVSEIMELLRKRNLEEKLFAGVNEISVKKSLEDGSINRLWNMFETVLEDVEREIFVYESVLEAYQRIIGKASVLDIAWSLSRALRFFVSASTYVTIYRGRGKIGYGISPLFPGGVFIPKLSEYSMLSSGIKGWHTSDQYTVYIDHKNDYTVLVYIDKANLSDMDIMYTESLVSMVLASMPMLAERQHAIMDTLTGLYVRWYVLRRLDEEWARSRREHTPLGVLYMDIDNFKLVNDTYGHAEGDRVLRQVASIIKRSCGPLDVPGRYGGEEFVVVLPGAGVDYAMEMAEKIRSEVEKTFKDTVYDVTISVGVAVHPPLPARSGVELLDMADKAMYYAKRHGKNRVVFASEDVLREVKDSV